MSFQQKRKVERRGMILRHLEKCKDYTASADILLDVLNGVGIPTYYNEITEALSWLENKGYVALSGDDMVVIAEATLRGLRLARDENVDPDVSRPTGRI